MTAARSQPAVVGGRLFVASESGDVFSLDAKTGCTYWAFHAQSGIRTAVSVGQYKGANGSAYAIYFTDGAATAYGVDANTGKQIWARKAERSSAGARDRPSIFMLPMDLTGCSSRTPKAVTARKSWWTSCP